MEAVAEVVEETPTIDSGSAAWMMTSTVLVIIMTVPGLALFYGGLVRAKNMLSVLMQVFVTFSLLSVVWAVCGYSLAFTEGSFNAIYGGFEKAFFAGITPDSIMVVLKMVDEGCTMILAGGRVAPRSLISLCAVL